MTHADSSHLPSEIKSKAQFWEHVFLQLQALLEGQTNWVCETHHVYLGLLEIILHKVSNCANASSLIYSSLLSFKPFFGNDDKAVNWCGKISSNQTLTLLHPRILTD